MKPHKWAKEIKAWADGAEIEARTLSFGGTYTDWYRASSPLWDTDDVEYRIKPQPKEPQYLYVYQMGGKMELAPIKRDTLNFMSGDKAYPFYYAGKIKLENENAI